MMLDHLGEPRAAERLMRAIERVTADPAHAHTRSRRQGDDAEVTDAVIAALEGDNL